MPHYSMQTTQKIGAQDACPPRRRDLLVFGEDWGGLPSSTQHLMRRIALGRSVVWLDSIGIRRPHLTPTDLRRAAKKLASFVHPRSRRGDARGETPPGLFVVAPLAIPLPGSKLARAINSRLLGSQINKVLRSRDMSDPIIWTSLPTAVVALEAIDARSVVYYCGDDYAALPGVDARAISRLEAELIERSDLIFAASETLAERFPTHKTIFLPHGVDVDLFARPSQRAEELPATSPVAGYYGSIADWVDMDLIRSAALRMPDWEFVFIGPISVDPSPLSSLPNFTLLGPRPYSELPRFAQHWTVSLLPFKHNPLISAFNPLKLLEYLAAGTPIASTEFPALAPYRDLVSVVPPGGAFDPAIRRAARDRSRNALRQHRVRHESWEARAAHAEYHLDRLAR